MALLVAVTAVTAVGCTAAPPPVPEVLAVKPVITSVGIDQAELTELVASGNVAGVSEAGGQCSFTFWHKNGSAYRLLAEGKPDGNATACGPAWSDLALLPPGTYGVVLTYESATAAGVSESVELVLP